MNKKALGAAVALVVMLAATAVQAMSVREFLATAAGIPRNPTALLRSDTRRLLGEIRAVSATLRSENETAVAAGRRPAYCSPERRTSVSADALLARFNAIPESRRDISVTQAMREWMAERYPCPA